jgi:hypothetical protein
VALVVDHNSRSVDVRSEIHTQPLRHLYSVLMLSCVQSRHSLFFQTLPYAEQAQFISSLEFLCSFHEYTIPKGIKYCSHSSILEIRFIREAV